MKFDVGARIPGPGFYDSKVVGCKGTDGVTTKTTLYDAMTVNGISFSDLTRYGHNYRVIVLCYPNGCVSRRSQIFYDTNVEDMKRFLEATTFEDMFDGDHEIFDNAEYVSLQLIGDRCG